MAAPYKEPTALRELKGNPGRRDYGPEPEPPSGVPDCPEWLGDVGRAKWAERVAKLVATNPKLITQIDGDMLGLYCEAWEELLDARAEIEREGPTCISDKGGTYLHPAVGRKNKAIARLKVFGALFGMSPSDRVGLSVGEKSAPENPFQSLLKSRASSN